MGVHTDLTPLGALCQYYLAALEAADADRIAVFGKSSRRADYAELLTFAHQPEHGINPEEVAAVVETLSKDRTRLVAYVGYLCNVQITGDSRRIEPLLVLPVYVGRGLNASITPDPGLPTLNPGAIRTLMGTRGSAVEDVIQLEDDLGLHDEPTDAPTLQEIGLKLRTLMPDWPWRENLQTTARDSAKLEAVTVSGLYARAVLFVAERSGYTVGLERELQQLAGLTMKDIEGTALGAWLSGPVAATSLESPAAVPTLLEVLPLNNEQRSAVQSALTAPLTVITGPPGTGKSQVVADILVNAAWHGQRVLFASKNNKAVDVVEQRVNQLGARPILLRLGAGPHEFELANFLLGLIEHSSSEDDEGLFDQALRVHQRLEQRLVQTSAHESSLIKTRNLVDKLDQDCEELRKTLPQKHKDRLRQVSLEPAASALEALAAAVVHAQRSEQPLLVRLLWPLMYRSARFAQVQEGRAALDAALKTFGRFSVPPLSDETIAAWSDQLSRLKIWLARSQLFKNYLDALKLLQGKLPLESLAVQRNEILNSMRANALLLWERWIKLRPSQLSAPDRQLLQQYRAVLKMAADVEKGHALEPAVQRQYRELFTKAGHLLPCWASTSLSVRGRVPFQAADFDLVVFDEASQCDIASALPLLYRAKRAVVIGDPKQLSHISGLSGSFDQMLLRRFGLAEERPEWAYHYNSLFDLAASQASQPQIVSLRDHHRSHADIIGFSNETFYDSQLRIATAYAKLNLPASGGGVRWIDERGEVMRIKAGVINRKEAVRLVQAIRDLMATGYRGTIGVVSPFRAQANLIRELVSTDTVLSKELGGSECLIDTVHKFQGDERDIVFFSPVLATGMPSSAETFLRKNGNLFNVAVTRARSQLVVVGDLTKARECSVPYLANFADYIDKLKDRRPLTESRSRRSETEYPNVQNPALVSEWEPILYDALLQAGIPTIPQYLEEKYLLDFALIKGDRRLNIEVDGESFHRAFDGEQCRRDQIRTQRMVDLGWDVLRFWVYEVRDDLPGCIARVQAWLDRVTIPRI